MPSHKGMMRARQALLSYQQIQRSASTAATAAFSPNQETNLVSKSAMLHRNIKAPPMQVVASSGTRMRFSNGLEVEDTTCGAAVACLGHGNKRVRQAMIDQLDKFAYCNSMFFGHEIGEDLATELINGTGGLMSKAYIMSSGAFYQYNWFSSTEF